MSHKFIPVWICVTDRCDKILSQRQRFSHVTGDDLLQQPVTAMCCTDLSHSVYRPLRHFEISWVYIHFSVALMCILGTTVTTFTSVCFTFKSDFCSLDTLVRVEIASSKTKHALLIFFLRSLLLEISPPASFMWDNLTTESAFETAVHSPLDRQDVQTLWTEYLFYQRSRASRDSHSMDELVNRCLMSVSTHSSLPHSSSAVWQDYRFHNQVIICFHKRFAQTRQTSFLVSGAIINFWVASFHTTSLWASQVQIKNILKCQSNLT